MKTDYGKLNHFDVLAVLLVAVGLVIVGIEIFVGLPQAYKQELSLSLNVFDMHEQIADQADLTRSLVLSANEFYDETYVAFAEVWGYPEFVGDWSDRLDRSFVAIGGYADGMAGEYVASNVDYYNSQGDENGAVLGAAIDRTINAETVPLKESDKIVIPYQYRPVKINMDYGKLLLSASQSNN